MSAPRRVSLAMTGASGVQYGMRLLECLVAENVAVDLMLSQPAQVVVGLETDWSLPGRPADIRKELIERLAIAPSLLDVLGDKQWTSAVASGSGANEAMVVCPCTTGTLAAIATGQSRSLLERAADVSLKECRQLILVVRETPFSEIHLEHMLRLSRMGVVIMPANPGFYHRPQRIEDLIDFMVARVLDHLKIPHNLVPVWGAEADSRT